jgi:hypothetical protein
MAALALRPECEKAPLESEAFSPNHPCPELATTEMLRGRSIAFGAGPYCTALIMSKIGRYMATTMPPTTTPRNTIITGSISASSPDTAASTSSS